MLGFSYLGIFLFISARFSVFASKTGKLGFYCFSPWNHGFHYFLGAIALLRKKLTECTTKLMASLCDSKTIVYAKCRIKLEFNVEREKKTWICFSYFICYCRLNLYEIARNVQLLSWRKDVFINDQYLNFVSSLLSNIRHYFFVILLENSSVCSRTYLFSSLEQRSPESNESRNHQRYVSCTVVLLKVDYSRSCYSLLWWCVENTIYFHSF